MKITNKQIEARELRSLGELIGNEFKLTEDFIDRYFGEAVKALLLRLSNEKDRAYVIEGCIGEGAFPGGLWSPSPNEIYLPSNEIEYQFEGEPEDVFETPDELTIHDDLAYLYTGYGASFEIDVEKLKCNIDAFLQA